jgi:hypothetical protein
MACSSSFWRFATCKQRDEDLLKEIGIDERKNMHPIDMHLLLGGAFFINV